MSIPIIAPRLPVTWTARLTAAAKIGIRKGRNAFQDLDKAITWFANMIGDIYHLR